MITLEEMLARILAHCKATGMSRRSFGVLSVNNPDFVYALERGRGMSLTTANKVYDFLEEGKEVERAVG